MKLYLIMSSKEKGDVVLTEVSIREIAGDFAAFLKFILQRNKIGELHFSQVVEAKQFGGISKTRPYKVGELVSQDDLEEIVFLAISGKLDCKIRDKTCRFISFGFDRQVFLCLKHIDEFGSTDEVQNKFRLQIDDISSALISSDFFDW